MDWSNLTVIDSAHLLPPWHFIWIKLYYELIIRIFIGIVISHFCPAFNYHQIQNCEFYHWVTLVFRPAHGKKRVFTAWGWLWSGDGAGYFSVSGCPNVDNSRARAIRAWGYDIFTLVYHFSFLSPTPWETAWYKLKYSIKGPLNPKQQPTSNRKHGFHMIYIDR